MLTASPAENAWLVKPDDPLALAQGLQTVLEDSDLRARLGRGAGDLARRFNYNERARTILKFCKVDGYTFRE